MRPNPDVLAQEVEGDIVLVHLQTNEMYELNRTGARLWQLLVEGCDRAQVQERMASEFDVEPETLTREIDALLAHLAAERLVTNDGD